MMGGRFRHVLSSAAASTAKSTTAFRRLFRLGIRSPFLAVRRNSSGPAMAVGAADKPSTTEPTPSWLGRWLRRTFGAERPLERG
ncbi:MAG: hypothetical protein HC767_08545 [Akkermansiaceae bacterium]|nr:hypothetical protein [Akkermansiaceae bacterium]